jgi:hypothetical protein
MYHGQIGQVEEGEWIQFRDQYVGNQQKDAMVDGLNQFASEIEKAQENNNMTRPGDKNLIAILREYIEIIRQTS